MVNLDGPTAAFGHHTPQLTMRSVHTIYGAETNCRIAHILGILLMNSCYTDRFLATTVVYGLSTLNSHGACKRLSCVTVALRLTLLHTRVGAMTSYISPFSSPEAAILLASATDRDLWPAPIFSPRFTDFRSFCAVSYFYQNGGPGNKFWTRNLKFQRHHIKRKTM